MHKKQIRRIAQVHGWWIYSRFLRHSRSWPAQRRTSYIFDQIKQVLVRAGEGTPYYRAVFAELGFDPRRDFRSPADLQQLPILTKDLVRDRFQDLLDQRFMWLSAYAETSGTTGQPLRMRLNESYIAFDDATLFRFWSMAGYRFRDPVVALRSYVPATENDPLWRYDKFQNCLFMSAYHLTPQNAPQYIEQILQFQPRFIRGYPSSLNVLAEYAYPHRERLGGVKALFASSETLLPTERAVIERTFGKKLFDWYGMTEPVLIITETADHNAMEINWEYGYAELLPGEDLLPGEYRLVATGFHNPVLPFIRYDTGDIVRLARDEAPGTFYSPDRYPMRIQSISGRKDECIVTPDGRRLPSVNFYTVFRDQKEVLKFQIVQYGLAEVVVKITLRPDAGDPAPIIQSLGKSLGVRLGRAVRLDIEVTDRFLTNADGKTQPIVRKSGTREVEEVEEYTISSQQAWRSPADGPPVSKLDWNEADSPVSPRVQKAIERLVSQQRYFNWYPEADSQQLQQALAQYTGAQPEQIIVTHGSDMAIESLGGAFIRRGDHVLIVHPSYDNFRAAMEQRGATTAPFLYDGRKEFSLAEFSERLTQRLPRMVYFTNPNNPVGYVLPVSLLGEVAKQCASLSTLVVVDEAYVEFSGKTAVGLLASQPNLLILRTFSKAFGLAGLRLGYIITTPELAMVVRRVVNPKNVTMFAKAAALAALEDLPHMRAYVAEVEESKKLIYRLFAEYKVRTYPSEANFILCQWPRVREMVAHLAARRIFVRDRTHCFGGEGHVRLTVGTAATTRRVIDALTDYFETDKRTHG